MLLNVYTDGSSKDNGKPSCTAGWSAVFLMQGKTYIRYGHLEAPSSNNRGEIMGVLYTMKLFRQKKEWDIRIHSDSQYVVKSVNEWRHNWVKNNYEGIKNPDLLVPLFNAFDDHGNAKISWVKAHAGIPGNEIADQYASAGTRKHDASIVNDAFDIKMVTYRDGKFY